MQWLQQQGSPSQLPPRGPKWSSAAAFQAAPPEFHLLVSALLG